MDGRPHFLYATKAAGAIGRIRWLVILLLTLGLHGLLLTGPVWQGWQVDAKRLPDSALEATVVALEATKSAPPAPLPQAAAQPRETAPRRQTAKPGQPSAGAVAPMASIDTESDMALADSAAMSLGADMAGEGMGGEEGSKSANALFADRGDQESTSVQTEAATKGNTQAYENVQDERASFGRLNFPPAVELRYDVEASIKGRVTQGHGRIAWHPSDSTYSIQGEAGVLFFNVLEFASEGAIDSGGILPARYREKRFRKAETSTHLDRGARRIHFSASPASFDHTGTEQDRASIVWQLAAMGRGNPDAFVPGRQLTMTIAAVRKTEAWSLRFIGLETIVVSGRTLPGWRVQREPLPGSDDQRIDFWFAPDLEWYPVRIRYSEANGDWLEMSLASPPQPAPP